MGGAKHLNLCPYNPVNIKKIVLLVADNLRKRSKFNKHFVPFPHKRLLDEFCKREHILRLKTVRKHYISKEFTYEDWLIELIDIAVRNGIVTEEQFPLHYQYIYDAWVFKNDDEWKLLYAQAMEFEDSEFSEFGI